MLTYAHVWQQRLLFHRIAPAMQEEEEEAEEEE
jgi:hypothetical protein